MQDKFWLNLDEDLPVFSEDDRQRIKQYIQSQARMLKYCHEVVIDSFPEVALTDPKGARSLAAALWINCLFIDKSVILQVS